MKKILVINSSAHGLNSQSRKLTKVFIDHWKSIHNNSDIRFRELGNTNVPHINDRWIAAASKSESTRSEIEIEVLKVSNTYITELKDADVILLASPMYNWSIPSVLKAYIDQVLRVNETFKINRANTKHSYVGLLENKTLLLLLSRGEDGYENGGYNERLDFQSRYLKTVFNIMGVSIIHVIAINGVSGSSEDLKKNIETSHQKIIDLIDLELI